MKSLSNVAFMSFCLLWLSSCEPEQESFIKKIDKETLIAEVIGKDVQLIDIRTPEEYIKGYIDDAINIDFLQEETFKKDIQKFDKNQPIYIYCRSGGRTGRASKLMQQMGFKKIFDYSGSYNDWSATE